MVSCVTQPRAGSFHCQRICTWSLKRAGEKDFSRYAVTPGVPLFQDLFVE